jgi:hypothetical protein
VTCSPAPLNNPPIAKEEEWDVPYIYGDNGFKAFGLSYDTFKDVTFPIKGMGFLVRAVSIQGDYDIGYHLEITKDEKNYPSSGDWDNDMDFNFVFEFRNADHKPLRLFYLSHHDICNYATTDIGELRSVEHVSIYRY